MDKDGRQYTQLKTVLETNMTAVADPVRFVIVWVGSGYENITMYLHYG